MARPFLAGRIADLDEPEFRRVRLNLFGLSHNRQWILKEVREVKLEVIGGKGDGGIQTLQGRGGGVRGG